MPALAKKLFFTGLLPWSPVHPSQRCLAVGWAGWERASSSGCCLHTGRRCILAISLGAGDPLGRSPRQHVQATCATCGPAARAAASSTHPFSKGQRGCRTHAYICTLFSILRKVGEASQHSLCLAWAGRPCTGGGAAQYEHLPVAQFLLNIRTHEPPGTLLSRCMSWRVQHDTRHGPT